MKDEELVSYIVKGKTDLFSVIIDRYQSKVFSTVYSYTHDHEEARDLTQEIFIKLYNNLQSYKNKAYIRKVVEDLPEIYKTVIILYYFEDFSPQEISDITDVPKRTIETRLYRGKNLLKLRLEELICGGEKHVLQ